MGSNFLEKQHLEKYTYPTRPIFFLWSSRNRVDLLSYESKPTDKWGQYDWSAEKNLNGNPSRPSGLILILYWLKHHILSTEHILQTPKQLFALKLIFFPDSQLDQIFLCDLVVLESICYRTRAKQQINNSKTTGGLRKIWTGSTFTNVDQ